MELERRAFREAQLRELPIIYSGGDGIRLEATEILRGLAQLPLSSFFGCTFWSGAPIHVPVVRVSSQYTNLCQSQRIMQALHSHPNMTTADPLDTWTRVSTAPRRRDPGVGFWPYCPIR